MARNITGNTPDFMRERSLDVMENIHQNMAKAYRAGVRMGWGSDADREIISAIGELSSENLSSLT